MWKKIYFKDDGQDILWWLVDDKGIVQACNMQGWVWIGTEVIATNRSINLEDLQPGDKLVCKYKSGYNGTFIHPVEKVQNITKKAGEKILLAK